MRISSSQLNNSQVYMEMSRTEEEAISRAARVGRTLVNGMKYIKLNVYHTKVGPLASRANKATHHAMVQSGSARSPKPACVVEPSSAINSSTVRKLCLRGCDVLCWPGTGNTPQRNCCAKFVRLV